MIRLIFLSLMILITKDLVGQNVKVVVSKDFPVSKYETFYVGAGDLVLLIKQQLADSTLKDHIKQTLVELIRKKGYTFRDDTTAELRVSYTAEVLENLQEENIGPLGQQPADQAAQMDQSNTWTQVSNETALVIEIKDVKSGQVIWKSSTTSSTASSNIEGVLLGAVDRSIRKLEKRKK